MQHNDPTNNSANTERPSNPAKRARKKVAPDRVRVLVGKVNGQYVRYDGSIHKGKELKTTHVAISTFRDSNSQNRMVKVLQQLDERGDYVAYNSEDESHKDQPVIEISRRNLKDSKKFPVLAHKRNRDQTYILYNKDLHGEDAVIIWVSKQSIRGNKKYHKKIRVVEDEIEGLRHFNPKRDNPTDVDDIKAGRFYDRKKVARENAKEENSSTARMLMSLKTQEPVPAIPATEEEVANIDKLASESLIVLSTLSANRLANIPVVESFDDLEQSTMQFRAPSN